MLYTPSAPESLQDRLSAQLMTQPNPLVNLSNQQVQIALARQQAQAQQQAELERQMALQQSQQQFSAAEGERNRAANLALAKQSEEAALERQKQQQTAVLAGEQERIRAAKVDAALAAGAKIKKDATFEEASAALDERLGIAYKDALQKFTDVSEKYKDIIGDPTHGIAFQNSVKDQFMADSKMQDLMLPSQKDELASGRKTVDEIKGEIESGIYKKNMFGWPFEKDAKAQVQNTYMNIIAAVGQKTSQDAQAAQMNGTLPKGMEARHVVAAGEIASALQRMSIARAAISNPEVPQRIEDDFRIGQQEAAGAQSGGLGPKKGDPLPVPPRTNPVAANPVAATPPWQPFGNDSPALNAVAQSGAQVGRFVGAIPSAIASFGNAISPPYGYPQPQVIPQIQRLIPGLTPVQPPANTFGNIPPFNPQGNFAAPPPGMAPNPFITGQNAFQNSLQGIPGVPMAAPPIDYSAYLQNP
jgi:hypothetical protein